MSRRIVYISGTRADFGLMESTLRAIHATPGMELTVIATAMHLDPAHGETIKDILASGLPIGRRVEVEHGRPSGALMARNIGHMVSGFVDVLVQERPDLVLLLGDRGEMLAAAIAALHLNIPIAHIHGGERSGTIDEPVRHAISKLAHLHLVATEESRTRLIRMGEVPEHVTVVGAPGLDGIETLAGIEKGELFAQHDLDPACPLALLVYHPVVQEAEAAGDHVRAILDALERHALQVLALRPNSDAGSAEIVEALDSAAGAGRINLKTHLQRSHYLSFLRHADMLVGNSSSGIIEAASFGTPVVNIGSRQYFRERNANVLDVTPEAAAISRGIEQALSTGRFPAQNRYGDGTATGRIVAVLDQLDLAAPALLMKTNAY